VVFLGRGSSGPCRRPSLPSEPEPSAASWRCGTRSHRRTPDACHRSASRATSTVPWPPRRALGLRATFFEWPAASRQTRDPAAHRGLRDLHPRLILENASQCSLRLRSGLFFSWVGNHSSSSPPFLAGGPGIGLGSTPPLSLRRLSQRLIEGEDTPKTLATSFLGIPRSTAANTLSLRSFEYALMRNSFVKDQPSSKPL
jgi:hypothetical protein